MAWIESHDELRFHPKLKHFARALDICGPQAVGHLHYLWWWASKYAQEGDLGRYTRDDIAEAGGWEGDTDTFIDALVSSGFLNADLSIHDWEDYAGRLIEKRRNDAERLKRWREGQKTKERSVTYDATPSQNGSHPDNSYETRSGNAYETRTKQVPDLTVPNLTVPDLTIPLSTGPDPTPQGGSRGDVALAAPVADKPPRGKKAPPEKPKVPKEPGPSLAPLVDAFRAIGLSDPPLVNGQARAAQGLLKRFLPEEIAACWQDVAAGEWPPGGDWLQANLSFTGLAGNNRIDNWRAWRNGERPVTRPRATIHHLRNGTVVTNHSDDGDDQYGLFGLRSFGEITEAEFVERMAAIGRAPDGSVLHAQPA